MTSATLVSGAAETATYSGGPRAFSGAPVVAEVVVTAKGDGWENPTPKMITRWAVCLFRDREDPSGYVTAEVIGLEGVASEGPDRESAMVNVKEALQLALDDLEDDAHQALRANYTIPSDGEVVYVAM